MFIMKLCKMWYFVVFRDNILLFFIIWSGSFTSVSCVLTHYLNLCVSFRATETHKTSSGRKSRVFRVLMCERWSPESSSEQFVLYWWRFQLNDLWEELSKSPAVLTNQKEFSFGEELRVCAELFDYSASFLILC